MSKSARASRGLPGGIVHMLYMTAFLLLEGGTLKSLKASLPEQPNSGGSNPDGTIYARDPAHFLYNDLPADQQQHWIAQLGPTNPAGLGKTQAHQPSLHMPCTYLVCEGDNCIVAATQRFMVDQALAVRARLCTESCSAGHSPFLSQPELVADLIVKVGTPHS